MTITPERRVEIERHFAKRKARRHALVAGIRGDHDNLPKTIEEARVWEPPEWAIQAIIEARTENLND